MVTKRGKLKGTDLAFHNTDPEKYKKRMQKRDKLHRRAVLRAPVLHTGPVAPGQWWGAVFGAELPVRWLVHAVTPGDTVTLHGAFGTIWITGIEELTRLGVLTGPPSSVIRDTVGFRGEDPAEAGSLG